MSVKLKTGKHTAKGHIEVRWLRRTHTRTLNSEHECRLRNSESTIEVEQVVFVFGQILWSSSVTPDLILVSPVSLL